MGNGGHSTEIRGRSGESRRDELPRFQIRFVERLYDGSPRWYNSSWREHIRRIERRRWHPLYREPGVVSKIRQAHESSLLYPADRTEYIGTCVNPACNARVQGVFTLPVIRELIRSGPAFHREKRLALRALANGEVDHLRDTCQSCGRKAFFFPVETIRNKWIYILKEEGGSLQHYCEIFSETPATGTIYTQLSNGRYTDRNSQPFRGYINLLPDPTNFSWHFFLSPVRLGTDALTLLSNSNQTEQQIASDRDNAHPSNAGVSVIPQIQPWKTTVTLSFSSAPRGRVELVPLVDPFSWAAQVADFDFLPCLAAQQKIVRDPDEQAKAFIASLLQQAMGRRQTSEDPPQWEDDPWDVADDTISVPSGINGSNIAEAWTNRYRDATEYLTEETEKACARLVYLIRYSLAHRIVEQSCQDWGQEPGFLSFGLVHWAHILREMPNCDTGKHFIAWLTGTSQSGSSPMRPAVKIPVLNVINGEAIRENSAVSQEVGFGILISIYSTLVPGIITRSNDASQILVRHLGNINIQASSIQGKDLQSARDLVLSVSSGLVDRYISRLVQTPNFEQSHRYTIANSWSERLTTFQRLSQFDSAMTLLLSLNVYTKSGRTYETGYDRYARVRDRIQTPIKIADFIAKNTRELLKAQFTGTEERIIQSVEQQGTRAIAQMSAADYEIFIASRSLRTYQLLGTGLRIIAGPIGVIIGGVEMVSETLQTIDNWEAGDPGASVGHGIQAAAGVLVIAVAAAECTALLTGAAVAAWAGPVGWIAAGLMLIGSIVISIWSKNDLEMLASHSFLGEEYGEGDWDDQTGKAWMGRHPWPWLRYESAGSRHRESRERWTRQRLVLLRMISSFKNYIGPGTFCGGFIFPTFLSNSSYFDIEVDVMPKDRTSPKETFRLKVWPVAREYIWIGHRPSRHNISFSPSTGDTVTSFTISAGPDQVSAELYDYEFRVKLDLDGNRQNYLPVSGSFLTNSTSELGFFAIYSEKDSTSID